MSAAATPGASGAERPRGRLTPAGAGLVIAVAVLLFALIVPVRTLVQQRSDLAQLQQQERLLERQNAAMKAQVARLLDPAYLERIARECLGMTKPGEISFVVVSPGSGRRGSAAAGSPAGDRAPFDPTQASAGC